jgi:hypothetical protein
MAETGRNKKLIASSHFSSSIADAGVRIYLLYQIVRPAVVHNQTGIHWFHWGIKLTTNLA